LKILSRRDQQEGLGIDVRVILEWILGGVGWEDVDWIHLAQDKNQFWALVSTVMNLQVP
jgi:hypothetical protein